ncbi:MAG: polymer-forming cytoskeletal protein [Limnochordia bacterium]|jgi:cytoskeletal protein CcmA (bactofilin family)|nr:polymer-forming cytoskeletal protein [Limnochordia bacterium]MDD2628609.1 polymer-forming cytoskeletal protein [Limnochordia bacterium]MDD4518119.1 polymer-forming cytoskeletal protein [Limnochordia bacterium]
MFRKSSDAGKAIETVIGKNTRLEGKLEVGGLRVEGSIQGDIESTGDVSIGPTGVVLGGIKAKNAIIAGKVQGEVELEQRLEILSGGYLEGTAAMRTLVIDEGAVFKGQCDMLTEDNGQVRSGKHPSKHPKGEGVASSSTA